MDRYVTVEEMRTLEANADYLGVGYATLMENAGKAVADVIMARYSPHRTLVVCGKGNNGGDGFVAARHLALNGFKVTVLLLGRAVDVRKGPAADNLEKLYDLGVDVMEADKPEALHPVAFQNFQLIVDAVLGTGSRGEPRGLEREAIELINVSGAPKVSVDVPSGLDCHTGRCDLCVRADLVITFHAPKPGLEPFSHLVADIGIPEKASTFVGPGDLANIRTRGDCSHKGRMRPRPRDRRGPVHRCASAGRYGGAAGGRGLGHGRRAAAGGRHRRFFLAGPDHRTSVRPAQDRPAGRQARGTADREA